MTGPTALAIRSEAARKAGDTLQAASAERAAAP